MKKANLVYLGIILLMLITATGCKKDTYLVRLMEGESIGQGTRVHLDNQPIGKVIDIIKYEGEGVAKFELLDNKYADRLLTRYCP